MIIASEPLTSDLLHILQHSLGVDRYGQGEQYRNSFCTGPGSKDFEKCRALCDASLMIDSGPQPIAGGMHYFRVTPAGIDAVALQSPAPPKLTRSKQRYRDYLRADSSLTFAEWLGIKGTY
ncbi:hypothetical protein OKA05_09045 [Luteolibacter arcticus]|uniref:Uncharacterized protein n=1 Tax=Luteolibacter arcticus TaxID=1581411 RepID=A0ABT3GHF2_9BACT|nr:hypothetical protein [Luteolibacter arcticus]MCW1922698.1 hypothetical protein [Luteolibacter arcticus]